MISFHPTISPKIWLKYLVFSFLKPASNTFPDLFPSYTAIMTDSGRSALALIIEALDLDGKTLILPAYVCEALLPILTLYKIRPIFLDVDETTYQPPLAAYTETLLKDVDAVLLVATYGKEPEQNVLTELRARGKIIIEDYAARSPLLKDPLLSDARIYSLPKALPVPDGGLALVSKKWTHDQAGNLPPRRISLRFLKDLFKLLPHVGPSISAVKNFFDHKPDKSSWMGATVPSTFTLIALSEILERHENKSAYGPYTYCYPLRVKNPNLARSALARYGISAEPIWDGPIIFSEEAQKLYNIDTKNFPATAKIAAEIICTPLWHIKNEAEYQNYTNFIEGICRAL